MAPWCIDFLFAQGCAALHSVQMVGQETIDKACKDYFET